MSDQLAQLARSLEESGHAAHHVAAYLTRCLFSMFAEDVELLPKGAFLGLLQTHRDDPATLQQMLRILWADMDRGGFSAALAGPVLHFNGKLFKGAAEDGYSLRLIPAQVDWLIDAAQVPQWRYVGARQAEWPPADFIVGNPPFIGAASMRAALGDGYVQALRAAWPDVPESADFVMFWWHHAAGEVAAGRTRRMGLITTNSLRQTFNRRVVEARLSPPPRKRQFKATSRCTWPWRSPTTPGSTAPTAPPCALP